MKKFLFALAVLPLALVACESPAGRPDTDANVEVPVDAPTPVITDRVEEQR